ncbi:MAG TPA: hypothetical protein VGF65_17155 [Mycobacterium sp.]
MATGQHFFHQEPRATHPDARSIEYRDAVLAYRAHLTVVTIDVTLFSRCRASLLWPYSVATCQM